MSGLIRNRYTLNDLVGLISLEQNLPKATTNLVLSSFFGKIVGAIKEDGVVRVDGFGTFDSFTKSSKKRPSKKTMKFVPSVICEKELNTNKES